MTGFVADVRPYVDESEVYVCPIWDGGGTRLKILDAMAMGKAVVSTTIACDGLGVSPEENILIADTPAGFVRQIKRVFRNEEMRRTWERGARNLMVEKYSWTVIGARLCTLYQTISGRDDLTSSEMS